MASKKRRIPGKVLLFNLYIIACVDFLKSIYTGIITHAQRLGVPDANMDIINGFRTSWATDDPDNPGTYQIYADPDHEGDKKIKRAMLHDKDGFTKAFHPVLDIIAASPSITEDDYNLFNIAIPKGFRTKKTTKIKANNNIAKESIILYNIT